MSNVGAATRVWFAQRSVRSIIIITTTAFVEESAVGADADHRRNERQVRDSVVWLAARDVRTLTRMAQTRTVTLGPASRPVAVPADLGEPSLRKAGGRVELPLHIRWSGSPVTYDLDDRADRARVYEQVLREGTEIDVRFYVKADELLELWDELVLPPSVRQAWVPWIEDRRRAA